MFTPACTYKNFDLKQYFKEGRGCRTEGIFRNPNDFDVNKGLVNLPYLQKIGRQINRRLLEVERVSHNSGLSGDSIQRLVQPTVNQDGEKRPSLKFGHPVSHCSQFPYSGERRRTSADRRRVWASFRGKRS